MFDRKAYMRDYYKKNKDKLKKYSIDYTNNTNNTNNKNKVKVYEIPIQVKKGDFILSFN
tara:strand:- start:1468 stop:1644 length:177 start_codon:yes stop_codon:yes gene_type:complete